MDTDRQEHTFDELQGVNYSFTVTQSGFSGGRVLSTDAVYARTFTAGLIIASHCDKYIAIPLITFISDKFSYAMF